MSISRALRVARSRRKKARGGSIEGDDKDDVTYGGTLPKSLQPMTTQVPDSWTRVPPRYAEGGGAGDDYNTTLTPAQEAAFQVWKQQNAPDDSGVDYDLRGAYLGNMQRSADNGHMGDQFKKPNHPTFSDQSQYAPFGAHGTWAGPEGPDQTFVPPSPMADGGTLPDVGDPKRADGGKIDNFNPERGAAMGLAREGMIKSSIPGRTDKLNLNVPAGSSIVPADVVSALGQGNTMAGSKILNNMFAKGPYGMNIAKASAGSRVGARHSSLSKMSFAKGGRVGEPTPIIAAGGEHILHPDAVLHVGHGDIDLGHKILNRFYEHVRKKNIKTLRHLRGPKNG